MQHSQSNILFDVGSIDESSVCEHDKMRNIDSAEIQRSINSMK